MKELEAIDHAARVAWGLSVDDLRAKSRKVPLCFQRALAVTTLAEEFGLTQQEACAALGRDQSNFRNMRRLVIQEIRESARARRLVAEFLEALPLRAL